MVKSAASAKLPPVPKPKATAMPRRFWTPKEEEILLSLLDALVAEGWKCDGTFQGGYMTRLSKEMNEKLPGCGLAVKHIRSKLTVWKRTHYALQGVLGSSGAAGFIMDPTLNMVLEDRDNALNDYIKADPKGAALIKGKYLPWHERWVSIFGKDQAAGNERYDIEDARNEVQNLSLNSHSNDGDRTNPSNYAGTETVAEEDDASSKGSSKNQGNVKKATSRKRKSITDDPAKITAMIGDWMETTKGQISKVSARMLPVAAPDDAQPGDDSAKRARIYSAINEACNLEMEDVITAAHHFSHSKPDMDSFWGMPVDARAKFVGYRWITRFLALGFYSFLLFPGFLQVGYYYFFSKQIRRSVVYGDQPRNRLDLYLPKNADGPKPVVAFITGGAWIIVCIWILFENYSGQVMFIEEFSVFLC